MHGPMLPLYGSGAVSVLIITLPVRDNLPLVFIMGMIGATLLEFFTGMVMESLFHVRYWDYSHLKFNVKGYICPVASLCWGVFSIMMVKVVHIPIEEVILKIPMAIADGLAFVLTVVAAVDFTQSFNEAMDMKKMLAQLDETKVQIRKLQERIREASEDMSENFVQQQERCLKSFAVQQQQQARCREDCVQQQGTAPKSFVQQQGTAPKSSVQQQEMYRKSFAWSWQN